MDDDDEPGLCCCEYMSSNGDRKHLAEVMCDCEEFDQIVTRLFNGDNISNSLWTKFLNTLNDRARVPTFGNDGAVQVGCSFFVAAFGVPLLFLIMALHLWISILFIFILPFLSFLIYRCIIRTDKTSRIFAYWTLWSFFWLLAVYIKLAVDIWSLVSWFSLIFLTLSLYYSLKTRQMVHNQRIHDDENLKICAICQIHVIGKDHHCVWLHCCIGKENYKSFVIGLINAWCGLLLGLYSSKNIWLYKIGEETWFSQRIAIAAGCYGCLVLVLITVLLLTQIHRKIAL